METTLSQNRQLFNVKSVFTTADQTPDKIPAGAIAIVDSETGKTVNAANYEALPKKFRIFQNVGGKLQIIFDCVDKTKMLNFAAKEYKESKQEKWEGIISHCNCIDSVKLTIFVKSQLLHIANGFPHGTTDFILEVAPDEFKCYCSCGEKSAYSNNVLTMLLYKQYLLNPSDFYKMSVVDADDTTLDTLEKVEKFVADNKEVNTDKDKENDGKLLKIVIEGKELPVAKYNPYNLDYAYPLGVNLIPSFDINSGVLKPFEKKQSMEFAIGRGVDLVHEEQENKSYYTTVGSYARNMHIIEFPEYQFDQTKNYDTLTFEFDSPKTLRAGKADHKRFMVILGSETGNGVHETLKQILIPA